MIIDAIHGLAQLLTRSSQLPDGRTDRQASYQLQLAPGQDVQAELLASLPNQRYLARIAGRLFNIELPIIVQPGETLQLTYVTGEPNTTFTLSRSGNGSAPATISDAGRLLNQLLTTPRDPALAGILSRGGPILFGPPADISVFGELLGEALSFNGIFYESHLLQWYCGERSLKDILREPQGKLSRMGKRAMGGNREGKDPACDPDLTPETMMDGVLTSADKNGPIDPRASAIVHEQLGTLHSGQVFWHGEVWPGQTMEWSVQEEKKKSPEGPERDWLTTLKLDLPNLGEVAATMRFERDGITIRIMTGSESTATLMRSEARALEETLSGAGIRLQNLAVDHEEHGE